MENKIQLLDCTLRDGAYIVDAQFGVPAMKGIIKKLRNANIDIIECGWLKNQEYKKGSTFYHTPADLEEYIDVKDPNVTYVAMIDWDRYDLDSLPYNNGRSIDAIRIVFPKEKFREGIALGDKVKEKGYKVFFQAANTLAYSDLELIELAEEINKAHPEALSIVDTFGAMYQEDLDRIISILNNNVDSDIRLGFHSHNNQQLSFSLSQRFVEKLYHTDRDIVIDASLCGMGRGAGNTTTELMVSFLNRKFNGNYDMNIILDAIDTYMNYFKENYTWGYSTNYFISGMYCAHVNNIAYLLQNHRTNAQDMRNIIESLSPEERKKYEYGLLEEKFLDYQNKKVDDEETINSLQKKYQSRKILLISPGRTIESQSKRIKDFIAENNPIVIGVNAVSEKYKYDYLFFSNRIRYDYAKEVYASLFAPIEKIITSNVKTVPEQNEKIVNFNLLIKRGWEHFDNATIMCLRLLNKLHVTQVAIAGFDGFGEEHGNYADASLPAINPGKAWVDLNEEIKDMFQDFKSATQTCMHIEFVTDSIFDD